MSLLLAWVVFPLVLTALALGCGLALAAASDRRLPGPLLVGVGSATIIVVAQFLTVSDATAELTTPIVVALAIAGFGFAGAARLRRFDRWATVAATAVFTVYAAPIVLSGEATFAGYIRLDDTATWMALTDRVIEHGRELAGLAPSTYEATLAFNLADGYPVGVFLPLGVARELLGIDVAWLIQPYMAWFAAVLALALWSCARPLVSSARLRAVLVFVAAQPALLFGYYLWGGIKELAAAALIASLAATVGHLAAKRFSVRAVVSAVFLCAALVGVLSAGGALWIAPALGLALALAGRALPARVVIGRAGLLAAGTAALAAPVLATGGLLPPTSSPLTDASARGNLIGPLEPAQIAGIWPAGDFRLDPVATDPAYVLIAVAICAALAGLVVIWRRRSWGALAYVGGSIIAAGAIYAIGSPWVDAKALATASPAIPFAAAIAVAALLASGRRVEGVVLLLAVAGGVVWSNVLAYRDVNLAPREQLRELEQIGELIEGEGPTLITEYQPYAARHFLRDSAAEGISELRRRPIPLRDGSMVDKGAAADTDEIDPAALGVYRTLVVRRSPVQSRPPAAYEPIWRGRAYEAWQRPPGAAVLSPRVALGDRFDPYAMPGCEAVRGLARRGDLVAARGSERIVVPLTRTDYPQSWSTPSAPRAPRPDGAGSIFTEIEVASPQEYEIWLGGSVRPRATLFVDGAEAGSVRHELNNEGQYVALGTAELAAGAHEIEVRFDDPGLSPGGGGVADVVGPLVLSAGEAAETRLVRIGSAEAERLCGREWDWIELAAVEAG